MMARSFKYFTSTTRASDKVQAASLLATCERGLACLTMVFMTFIHINERGVKDTSRHM